MAKKNLLGSMAKFQSDMEDCAEWAKDTEAQFDALVRCAQEVNLAMSDEMSMLSPSFEFVLEVLPPAYLVINQLTWPECSIYC